MKALCFSPNDAVWVWAKPQAQVLKALKDRGDTIHYAYCDRTITDFCMSMASSGVSFHADKDQKDQICTLCAEQSLLLRNFIGVGGFPIHNYIRAEDRKEAQRITDETPIDQLGAFCLHGVPIGQFAFYEAMIQTKSFDSHLDQAAENVYRAIVRNSYIVTSATVRMVAELSPDIGLTYHALYSYNRCFAYVLEKQGIAVWSLNGSSNVAEIDTHLIVGRTAYTSKRLLRVWPYQRAIPASENEVASAADHIIALMAGRGGYSKSLKHSVRSIDERLGIKPGRKVLAALMSSYDEIRAAQMAGLEPETDGIIFPTQADWVKWLIGFARESENIHVVIRVHPREFRKGTNDETSPHVKILNRIFQDLPPNVSINIPENHVSNYELLMRADAIAVAWTSVGQEAVLLGIPVVTYFDEVLAYPAELTELGRTFEHYHSALNRALAVGWSLERSRQGFRWAALLLCRPRIDLTNGARLPIRQSSMEIFGRRVLRKLRRVLLPGSEGWWSIRSAPKSLDVAKVVYRLLDSKADMFFDLNDGNETVSNPREELAAIRVQLARISSVFYRSTGVRATKLDAMLGQAAIPPASADRLCS
jgi:hypothetical protein